MKGRRLPQAVLVLSLAQPMTGSTRMSHDLANAVKKDKNARLAPCMQAAGSNLAWVA